MFESAAVVVGGVIVAVIGIALYTIKRLMIIVPPNAAAVITGRQRLLGDGTPIGYRTVTGGRTLRVPSSNKLNGFRWVRCRWRSACPTPTPKATSRWK